MVSKSFITQSSIDELFINKQVGEKPLFFFFPLEGSSKLSLLISFIELYSLKFKSQ